MSSAHALSFPSHSDDDIIDTFANAMRDRMALGCAKGRGGWHTCPVDVLWQQLREHVDKGDPVDIATLAMMIHSNATRRA